MEASYRGPVRENWQGTEKEWNKMLGKNQVYTPAETLLTAQTVMPTNATYLEFVFPQQFKLPYVTAVSHKCQHPMPK